MPYMDTIRAVHYSLSGPYIYIHNTFHLHPPKSDSSYANIFIGWFEEKFIFPLLTNLSDFYECFIDDIFLIWNETRTEFDNFLKNN